MSKRVTLRTTKYIYIYISSSHKYQLSYYYIDELSRLFTTTIFNRFFYLSFYKGTTYGMISLNDVTFAKSPLHRFSRSTAFNELVANVFQPCRDQRAASPPPPPSSFPVFMRADLLFFLVCAKTNRETRVSLRPVDAFAFKRKNGATLNRDSKWKRKRRTRIDFYSLPPLVELLITRRFVVHDSSSTALYDSIFLYFLR